MEENGATLEELAPLLSGLRGLKALQTGEMEDALIACGQVVGLIKDIPTVKELIDGIIAEAENILKERMCRFI